jgi:L-lactate dehydrogenase complex protein LldF
MHLNHYLERNSISAIESDLGEYIIQLAGETPSHIVMPCIHKNVEQIAQLFADHIPEQAYTEDVDTLTAAARRVLRERFANADAGISGVNFAVAETGTLVLIENEGNGRLSTTLPSLHIAVTGIEKVVEFLADIPPLLALLPRSATGQPITTYVNMISSPRREGEKDGPTEVHLVLLDNGRSKVYADRHLRDTLRCIRCGACMNHCPVYGRVGGHAYDAVYPGPIGKILMPQLDGIESKGELAHASTLCGACAEVCPVKIPIPDILVRLREESVNPTGAVPHSHFSGSLERIIWSIWCLINTSPLLYRLSLWGATRLGRFVPDRLFSKWTMVRSRPKFASKSLHELAMEEGFEP